MTVREYQFVVGAETGTIPTAGTPTLDGDLVSLGFANAHYVQGSESVADVTALQAIAAADRANGNAVVVQSTRVVYVFDSASVAAADGVRIVQPTVGSGRWYRVSPLENPLTGDVTVANDLTVTGNMTVSGTTTTVNTTNLDVEDPSIKVNNGGTQATANAAVAGLEVEMSDATNARIGYDSTLTSKFKAGESGSESELITAATDQTITGTKTSDKEFITKEIATPATPSSGYRKIYAKSDGFYDLDSTGTETQLGGLASSLDSSQDYINLSIAASVAANALTIELKNKSGANPSGASPGYISFRNATSTTGTYTRATLATSSSMTVSSGSTLGATSGVQQYNYIYALNNAGTIEPAISSSRYDDGSIVTTVAEGGAGAADSLTAIYSTTARTDVPIRLIGRILSTQATAGTWATAPSEISNIPFRKFNKIQQKKAVSNYTTNTAAIIQFNNLVVGRKYLAVATCHGILGTSGINNAYINVKHNSSVVAIAGYVSTTGVGATFSFDGFACKEIFTAVATTLVVDAVVSGTGSTVSGGPQGTEVVLIELNDTDVTTAFT